ncbi:MAG: hypothetical protein Q9214_000507 [Letrouitia sp. 1 TL-2023]
MPSRDSLNSILWHLKIADFGLSNTKPLVSEVGSQAYMAPEIDSHQYTNAVDIWSVGVILFEMFTGTRPFLNNHERSLYVQGNQQAFENKLITANVPSEARDFIKRLMAPDPRNRPGAAYSDKWIVDGILEGMAIRNVAEEMEQSRDLETNVFFLSKHNAYQNEKPYSLTSTARHLTTADLPATNVVQAYERIAVKDLRGIETDFTFQKSGFAVINMSSAMSYDDFDNPDSITRIYQAEVGNMLLHFLEAAEVHVFNYRVRGAASM